MNLRKMTLKYMGWCPGVETASQFIPDRELGKRDQDVALLILATVIGVWHGYHESSLLFTVMWIVVTLMFIIMRRFSEESGSRAFEPVDIETGRGARCTLIDCSHNKDAKLASKALRVGGGDFAPVDKIEIFEGMCSTDSHPEPILDVMTFTGYCPEYDGEKFPDVRDVSRKGKSMWDRFLRRDAFWLRDRGGPFEITTMDIAEYWRNIPLQYPALGWEETERDKEDYLANLERIETEARRRKKKKARTS